MYFLSFKLINNYSLRVNVEDVKRPTHFLFSARFKETDMGSSLPLGIEAGQMTLSHSLSSTAVETECIYIQIAQFIF